MEHWRVRCPRHAAGHPLELRLAPLCEAAGRALEVRIREEAKAICESYLCPPHTTDFADPAHIHGHEMPGLEELADRRGEEQVTLAWLADQMQAFVDQYPDFEVPVERLATWLARGGTGDDELDD